MTDGNVCCGGTGEYSCQAGQTCVDSTGGGCITGSTGSGGSSSSGVVCFPGQAHVSTPSGEIILMNELTVGDEVVSMDPATGLVASTSIVAFLHVVRDFNATDYVRISTASNQAIVLSMDHVVFTVDKGDVLAKQVRVGDEMWVHQKNTMHSSVVTKVEHNVQSLGAFAPLTETGVLVVDGVLSSCFASTTHDLGMAWSLPLRLVGGGSTVNVPVDGMHPYAALTTAMFPEKLWRAA